MTVPKRAIAISYGLFATSTSKLSKEMLSELSVKMELASPPY